jgi:hypothetical protein
VIEPVRDGLAHRDAHAGQVGERGPQVGEDRLGRALRAPQLDVDLAVVDALGVLVALGAAGASPVDHPGTVAAPLGEHAQLRGLGARFRGALARSRGRALGERRQERPPGMARS